MTKIEPGSYEYFKGQQYEVLGTARRLETEEAFVSYRKHLLARFS